MEVKDVIENWNTWSDGKKFRFVIELLRSLTNEQVTQVADYLDAHDVTFGSDSLEKER